MNRLLPIILLLTVASCAHEATLPEHNRPDRDEYPDWNIELDDSTTRFTHPDATMYYDQGGILLRVLADGTICGNDLTTGRSFSYNHEYKRLVVNDTTTIELESAEIRRRTPNHTWYRLIPAATRIPITLVD